MALSILSPKMTTAKMKIISPLGSHKTKPPFDYRGAVLFYLVVDSLHLDHYRQNHRAPLGLTE